MIERLAILGLGLIGGSLALAWKRSRSDLTLIGYDRPEVLDAAFTRGMVDHAAASPVAAAAQADLVVLATPLGAMAGVLQDIAPHLRPGTVVTDVGSVKKPVMAAAQAALAPSNPFVGGHPMAGSERGGLSSADAFLFENATYVLCPSAGNSIASHEDFLQIIEATGARVLLLDANRHDTIAACTSHLPQLLATTLMNVAAQRRDDDEALLQLAAGGFRDMTRIASSPYALWQPILEANQDRVVATLNDFVQALQHIIDSIIGDDQDAIGEAFARASELRNRIPKDSKGFLHPLADVFVYAEDRPGTLTHITHTLFDSGINIKDIELLKIREGTGGAFRLSFVDDQAAETAVTVLMEAGCRAHRL